MLGRLEMTVEECIEAFQSLSKAIFEESAWESWTAKVPFTAKGKVATRFSSEKLKNAVLKIIQNRVRKIHENTDEPLSDADVAREAESMMLNDGVQRGCKTYAALAHSP
jgi:hypothetical protein